ncbi:MAG: helix-turn-helix transcriptional regulator [Myxococcaceae bacterium]
MTSSDYVAFGRYLQQQRELRGLSVDAIAQKTKIPPTLIGALEEGQAERFPERVFLLNYLRSYAGVVGLSPDDTVNRFHQIPEAPREEAFDPAALEVVRRERAQTTAWSTLAAVVGLGALLGLNALYELALRFTHR